MKLSIENMNFITQNKHIVIIFMNLVIKIVYSVTGESSVTEQMNVIIKSSVIADYMNMPLDL